MNKAQVVSKMAKDAGITKKQAAKAVDSMLASISKALKKGERVGFVGFGSFSVRKRAARKARNPRTGQVIQVRAKKVPVFRPGDKLRKSVK
jgi:DNA-binding protein HU-beta